MTDEANHVIDEAFKNGCREVIVNDSHSKMNNLLIERLHPEARLISGDVKPFSMVQGLDDTYDGAVFVGYHARASMRGVMSHSMIFGVRHFYINDQAVGELGFNAYVAGYYGVPVIMAAGDSEAAAEAEEPDSERNDSSRQRNGLPFGGQMSDAGESGAAIKRTDGICDSKPRSSQAAHTSGQAGAADRICQLRPSRVGQSDAGC